MFSYYIFFNSFSLDLSIAFNTRKIMELKIGNKAPNICLRDTQKEEVCLSDFLDSVVVLLFFPLAFTGVCTEELCQIRDERLEYDKLKAQILAISVRFIIYPGKVQRTRKLQFSTPFGLE